MKEINGCGKSTQAEMLKETLERVGMNPCLVKASLAAGGVVLCEPVMYAAHIPPAEVGA